MTNSKFVTPKSPDKLKTDELLQHGQNNDSYRDAMRLDNNNPVNDASIDSSSYSDKKKDIMTKENQDELVKLLTLERSKQQSKLAAKEQKQRTLDKETAAKSATTDEPKAGDERPLSVPKTATIVKRHKASLCHGCGSCTIL
jgi:hypothetical protein